MQYILQVIANLTIGGAEKVARDIALHAEPGKYEFHYIVFGDQVGDYEQDLIDAGHRIFHIPSPSENYLKYYNTLKHMMREYRYSAVHAHTMFNAGWAMLAAKQAGVPIRISHAHSSLDKAIKSSKVRVYETAMRNLILTHSTDYLACGVEAGNRLFGEKAFCEKGTLILNGIDTTAFSFRPEIGHTIREDLRWQDAFVIGHVGHLAEVKNQSFLLRLMPEILKRKPNAKLLMLGEGEDRPMLESQIQELGLKNKVIMTGNVRNVSDYLSAMDVFAFPSLYEGMPLSIVEVQANGLPCVLSTGVPKDVYLTDLVHPLPLDKLDAWVESICNAQRSEPEKYAGELKAKGFDTETVMKKFLDIYERADKH